MNEENCPFCVEVESKSRIISESQYTLIILSNPALIRGYCWVILKRHVERFDELLCGEFEDLFHQIKNGQKLSSKKFSGGDISQHHRPFIPQSRLKMNHLHVHLIPRELGDELYKRCQIYEKEIFKDLN